MKNSISRFVLAVACLTLALGMLGGGVVGGVAGYYVAQHQANLSAASPIGSAQPSTVSNRTASESSAITQVVQKAEPAVVTVVNTAQVQSRRFGNNSAIAEGSGVIIDSQGHIVTNAHVV